MRHDKQSAQASGTMLRAVQTPARIDWLGERITGPRRFKVSVARGDGTVETYERTGGCSADHTAEAFEHAGEDGVIGLSVIALARAA